MSISASAPPEPGLRLRIHGNADAELYVIGSDMRTAGYGVGEIDDRFPPGIYKLRAVRGGAMMERLIELSNPDQSVLMRIDAFAAIAPIGPVFGRYRSEIEAVTQRAIAAGSNCSCISHEKSKAATSSLLVLGHSAADGLSDPLENIRVFPWRQSASRQKLDCDIEATRIGEETWRAWFRRCEPGPHVIEFHDGTQWVRQALLTAPNWETRVFVRRSGTGGLTPPEISVQMARPGRQVFYDDQEETIEVARHALETGRPIIVSDRFLDPLLDGKFENPIMGITGLHLFLEALERHERKETSQKRRVDISAEMIRRSSQIIRTVLANLAKLLGATNKAPWPADLAGLEARATPFIGIATGNRQLIDHPPMFWASWTALRDAGEHGRFAVQHRLWTDTAHHIAAGPYFSWQARRVSLSDYVDNAVQAAATSSLVISSLAGSGVLAAPALAVAGAITASRVTNRRRKANLDLKEAGPEIGKALGIPASVIKSL